MCRTSKTLPPKPDIGCATVSMATKASTVFCIFLKIGSPGQVSIQWLYNKAVLAIVIETVQSGSRLSRFDRI
jgi:hypothetical protein